MNLRLKCPCGKRFETTKQAHVVRCPTCGRRLRVPGLRAIAEASSDIAFEDFESSPSYTDHTAAEKGKRSKSSTLSHDFKDVLDGQGTRQARSTAALGEVGEYGKVVSTQSTTWQPHASLGDEHRVKHRGLGWLIAVLLVPILVPTGVVGTLLAISVLSPKDARENVAEQYLDAIAQGDWPTANRLSVMTMHPRVRSVHQVSLEERDTSLPRGTFVGLAEFHARIHQKYTFNSQRGRFELKDIFGTGLDVLAAVEQVKKKVEEQAWVRQTNPSMRRVTSEESLLDDVLNRYGAIAELVTSSGAFLSSQDLGPTYGDLLSQTEMPLSDAERALAHHYMRAPEKWDRLLGRSFLTLPGDLPFELHEVQITAVVYAVDQSYGASRRQLTLQMVRFVTGSIDTGWRVWSALLTPSP